MRELKFRAWDKERKEMTQIYGAWFEEQGNYHEIDLAKVAYGYILMQYTGLKDKNGKPIYEGDIVQEDFFISRFFENYPPKLMPLVSKDAPISINGKWKETKQDCVFEVKSLREIFKYIKDIEDICKQEDIVKCYNGNMLKVIGNIYENPELLKCA